MTRSRHGTRDKVTGSLTWSDNPSSPPSKRGTRSIARDEIRGVCNGSTIVCASCFQGGTTPRVVYASDLTVDDICNVCHRYLMSPDKRYWALRRRGWSAARITRQGCTKKLTIENATQRYVGLQYGQWTIQKVVQIVTASKLRRALVSARCKCGRVREHLQRHFAGNPKCQCSDGFIGKSFGKLTVLYQIESSATCSRWVCECACGRRSNVYRSNLVGGRTTSCGCGEYVRTNTPATLSDAALIRLNSFKKGAAERGYVFELHLQDVQSLVFSPCHYCGVLPSQKLPGKIYHGILSNGIDRYDNDRGYTVSNCVPCCGACNRAKGKMRATDFINWLQRCYKHTAATR